MRFVHLNVHSNYSFCRGASRLEDLVVAARRRGMDAMALTDTNGLYGLVWFLDAAKAAGVRPIVGAEVDLHALARRAEFDVEPPGDPWVVPGEGARVAGAAPGAASGRPLATAGAGEGRRGVGHGPERNGAIGVQTWPFAGTSAAAAAPGPDERLADRRAWGRAVVLVKDADGYASLCRLLSALHHGGDWPPPDRPDEREAARRQLRVTDRVAGYPLRMRGSDGNGAGVLAGQEACGDSAVAGDINTMKRASADRLHLPLARPPLTRAPLTRAWLAEALAALRGCIVLSADAGLLARIARIARHRGETNPTAVSPCAPAADGEEGAVPVEGATLAADLYVE